MRSIGGLVNAWTNVLFRVCPVSLSLSSFAGGALAASNNVLSANIKEADATTGQDTNSGSGIKTDHIQDAAVTGPKIADGAVTAAKMKQTPSLQLVWWAGYFNGMGGGSTQKLLFDGYQSGTTPAVYLLTTSYGTFALPEPSTYLEQHNDWHLYILQDEVGGHTFGFEGDSILWETPFAYSANPRTLTHIEFRPIQFCVAYDRTEISGACIDQRAVWMARIVSTDIPYAE